MKKSAKKVSEKESDNKKITNFLFEVGILARTPRSGFHFLGTGNQTVAEHINRVCFIGYMLAEMDGKVDISKVFDTIKEYEERQSRESVLVKDADNLEWILALKEEVDTGNTRALKWISSAVKRLKTPFAISLAKEIMETDSNDWWFDNERQKSDWWVNRGKK